MNKHSKGAIESLQQLLGTFKQRIHSVIGNLNTNALYIKKINFCKLNFSI